jgi:hypothetical protein
MPFVDFDPATRASIVASYKVKRSLAIVAKEFHTSPRVVRRILEQEGVTIQGKGGKRPQWTPEALTAERRAWLEHCEYLYWGLNMTFEEVAEQVGVKPATIRHRFVMAGIPARDQSESMRVSWSNQSPEERSARGRTVWNAIPEHKQREIVKRLTDGRRRVSVQT